MFNAVAEVMFFVEDRRAAAEWYSTLLDLPISQLDDPDLFFIRVGSCDLWFHQADDKSRPGTSGQVAYWTVDSFGDAVARAERSGAMLYRGPLDRGDGTAMCQMQDPFGNVFGLIGPEHYV